MIQGAYSALTRPFTAVDATAIRRRTGTWEIEIPRMLKGNVRKR
ncbi:MAG: hypothetical protein ACRDOL_03260 [Streptosporangiaceae bacterium]